ncbi:MAG: beta-galactosidase trimerization domain-containing protein, partial [Armatimonadetes bacterium]|nr:beta-galactosidase trimerization domain-containing protein [Armatimonadota bacterium]
LKLNFRQVHLDFHTSEAIPGIGAAFEANEFADTLAAASVNSVTCFSRGHHGWIFHDTTEFPERRHPHLTCNLLAEQIEACHARGIRVPIYITVRWDHFTARQHPEWLVVDENGAIIGTKPYEAGFYRQLCLNSPYVDFLEAQTLEVCHTLPCDGFFFDIVFPTPCSCENCKRDMIAAGMDPSDAAQRKTFADQVLLKFEERISAAVRGAQPDATIFYNGGHVGPYHRGILHNYTHLELESLPSGGWGYMHFPVAQRYARTLGAPTMGMTGKFHTSWGDFSSFKNQPALEFECLNMIAMGAQCSVGDQLHPSGKIDAETYKLIGSVYSQIAAVEPWCRDAQPVADIGVFTPEEFLGGGHGAMRPAIMGATRILQELRQQFDIIDSRSDLSRYKLLILPDEIPCDEKLAEALDEFVVAGGALIVSYHSGLRPEGDGFSLQSLNLTDLGEAPYSPDFIVAKELGGSRPETGQVMYDRGRRVAVLDRSPGLADMIQPYFNRTWEHFCSHRHTPADQPAAYPGATRCGNVIYFMHPLFGTYEAKAPLWCKELVRGALEMLLPEPALRVEGPSTLQASLNVQSDPTRQIVHLLHYIPERRGREFDIIEDVIPLYNVKVSVRVDGRVPARVTLEPQGQALEFEQQDGRVEFTVSELNGHQIIVVA